MRKHWYKKFITYCPLCLKESVIIERVYGTKPEDPLERIEETAVYDYCDS